MTQPEPERPDMPAALRLSVAIDQLVQPGLQQLDRDHAAIRATLAELDLAHVDHIRALRRRHNARQPRDAGRRRDIDAMTRAGHRYRQHRAQLEAGLRPHTAALPPLLTQLEDAVHSSNGTGNNSHGAHRSPLNTTAVELLTAIRRATHAGEHQPTDDALQAWQPDDPETAAEQAQHWCMEARAIVNPSRWSELVRPCPACGTRHVVVTEDGQRIRKAAIQLNLTDRYAACIHPACNAWWPPERFNLLAAALAQEDVAS